jgi:hypothetical protein
MVQGIVFHSSELNGDEHLRLVANKIYIAVIVNINRLVSAYNMGVS